MQYVFLRGNGNQSGSLTAVPPYLWSSMVPFRFPVNSKLGNSALFFQLYQTGTTTQSELIMWGWALGGGVGGSPNQEMLY